MKFPFFKVFLEQRKRKKILAGRVRTRDPAYFTLLYYHLYQSHNSNYLFMLHIVVAAFLRLVSSTNSLK